MKTNKGIPASPGIAIGQVLFVNSSDLNVAKWAIKESDVSNEIMRFEDALMVTREEIVGVKDIIQEELDMKHAEIFNAHLLVLEDRTLIEEVIKNVKNKKLNVEFIFYEVIQRFISAFGTVDDPYIKERIADFRDIAKRVLRNLLGESSDLHQKFDKDTVVISYDIAPSDTAHMHKEKVIAFVTEIGSRTSHTAIMARSLRIPAVVGVPKISQNVHSGDLVIVDGNSGTVIVNPTEKVIDEYRKKIDIFTASTKKLESLKDLPAITTDNHKIELYGNIEFSDDVYSAQLFGAGGIGLYRTEFFYMNRMDLPSEDEHFEAYKMVAEKMKPNKVTIRTLDLGGDKFLSHLEIPKEMNPFMGWRAIRFCLERLDIFKVQLRAILRASVYGNIQIMFPMISTLEELLKAKQVLFEVMQSLKDSNIPYNKKIKIGAMIEVPAAAVIADILAKEVDFFSIGTNDLIQYSLAVDRVNEKIAYLYQPTNPAIIRLIKNIIDAGHKEGIPVAMCGEMSGEALYTMLLIGLGIDELSLSPLILPEIKKVIRSISKEHSKKFVEEILTYSSAEEIDKYARKELKKILPEKVL